MNHEADLDGLKDRVRAATDGRGADVVLEVVGSSSALRLAFELLRPWGTISSIGVHGSEVCLSLICRFLADYMSSGIADSRGSLLWLANPLDRQRGIRQEPALADGPLSGAVDFLGRP